MAARAGRGAAGLLTRLQTTAPTVRALSMSHSLTQKVLCSLWKLGRLNHVAIAVPDLEKAQSFYKNVLGAQVSETVPLPEHGVYTVFVELGNTKLELLHPLGEKSPIAGFLQKNKAGGMHHICIEELEQAWAKYGPSSHQIQPTNAAGNPRQALCLHLPTCIPLRNVAAGRIFFKNC
ncbi:methylmalonyl-CoA epimerase, mitochondrial isoform X1 [Pelodiscus sinensis]|uniref:methylmalonyl-CoA epimerase, mitochondrial isoform X1 n=1 Tax=Pelodiscus sinensis TaxID=13735 RepID=UPI003F6A758C